MKRIKVILSAVMMMVSASAFAQITVNGTVTDTKGEPLVGATVYTKDARTGTASDLEGKWQLKNVGKDDIIVASLVGYHTAEQPCNGNSVVNFVLESDSEMLEETIVVAYGVQKKSSFVGAATQVSGEKLEKMQSTNISKGLEGAISGVQISSSSGSPGSGASIHVRGIGSISASQSPLIIVDGVPYEGSLNSIPQQDIESITVLKDAAANSMYGARGSNGVIMITTKRGSAGKVHISFDAKVGVNSRAIPSYETIQDPAAYYEMFWESVRNSTYYTGIMDLNQAGLYASNAMTSDYGLYNIYKGIKNNEIIDPATGKINPNAKELKWNENWEDIVFRPGTRQEYSLSASGGSEKTQGYFSISYLNDGGYVANSGFKRLTARAKVDHQFASWLKAGMNVSYANTDRQTYSSSEGNNYSNLFFTVAAVPCIYPVYLHDQTSGELIKDKDGNPEYDWGTNGRPFGANGNAYGQLMTSLYNTTIDNLSSRGYVTVNFLKNLSLTANVAYDVFNTKDINYYTPVGGDAYNVIGRGYQEMDRYYALNANQILTWAPSIGKNNFNVLLGHETKKDQSYMLYGHMVNFVDKKVPDFSNATEYQELTSSTEEYFLQGFFARGEWNYDERFFASASFRRDGSSRFAPKKRWGNFWSVGGAWNIANEKWMSGVSAINSLKLKASYGTQGNDNIGHTYVYENLYRIDRVDGEASLTKTFRAAPDVTWEKSNNFNVGFETRLFNRVTINADYFVKKTTDMIYGRPLAPSQGLPASQLVNDIDMQNNGIEFDIDARIIDRKNFTWNINLNGTHYKNTITKLPVDYPEWGKQVGNAWREVGQPLYNYYLKEYAGVNPATGQPLFNKYEKDEKTGLSTGKLLDKVTSFEEATYVKTGKTPIPDIYGGFGTDIKLFGFDFAASFAYQLGGYTLDSVYQSMMSAGDTQKNWHKDIYNRWTPENTNTDIPRVQNGAQQANQTSTRFLISSSYISLRYVTLGYTLPKSWTDRLKIQGIRIYCQGENLWYLSARKGMDVRKSFSGATGNTYSALRTISGGVSVNF
ncbi:MAG: SusC/RagA family TonB-linked outer membrane protein [Bacteroidales bacterium]|nr:SusC/RagA family TonB-linked outer membrane protein [Candidatus Cryptobacteroides equifaecalis]